ncbi:hypothetical protein BDV40DRAFT_267747 [Aspergillus tamarii]|uniref:Uncharacterized protein n=1 Tax=Aspergillus tamarii TaxID=41984 RepID=A0A5N6USB9_ASPTM|nr:hypothetical protein BDV40DRAFT_267747 [Aspergillus tamarii]
MKMNATCSASHFVIRRYLYIIFSHLRGFFFQGLTRLKRCATTIVSTSYVKANMTYEPYLVYIHKKGVQHSTTIQLKLYLLLDPLL